jgi:hypothetical protein
MGIDVWHLRPAAQENLSDQQASSPLSAQPATTPQRFSASEPHTVRPTPIAPFVVVSLIKQDVLLLMAPRDLEASRRFARDVLAAATGVRGGESGQRVFDWPQPGIENSAASLNRALGAFVAKQISDNDSGMTLIGAELLDRLDGFEITDNTLVMAAIDELMTSAELKRKLWLEIERNADP